MQSSCLYTGIFLHEFAVSLLQACQALMANVFEDLLCMCQRVSDPKSRFVHLVDRVPDWGDEIFEREVGAISAAFPFFEDAVQRSFEHFVRSFFRRSDRVREVRNMSAFEFVQAFTQVSSRCSFVREASFFDMSLVDQRGVLMDLIRAVFRASIDDHVMLADCGGSPVDPEVGPSDSISNVCLGEEG
tara:strand:+ start:619 stop:1179 length:561 start_codon:yes stop_codon:yes gene_type:complete